MGSGPVGGQGEGIHLSARRSHPDQVQGLGMEELKAFLQEQLRNAYDLKEGAAAPGADAGGRALLYPSAD